MTVFNKIAAAILTIPQKGEKWYHRDGTGDPFPQDIL